MLRAPRRPRATRATARAPDPSRSVECPCPRSSRARSSDGTQGWPWPADAHRVAERRLVGPLSEVGDVLLEVVGEPRLWRCPRHQLNGDAAAGAARAADGVAEPEPHAGYVQVPPATSLVGVVDGVNALAASRADGHPSGRRHVD